MCEKCQTLLSAWPWATLLERKWIEVNIASRSLWDGCPNPISNKGSVLPSVFPAGKQVVLISSLEGFPGGSDSKESTCSAGDLGSIPGSGRSLGKGNGNPLQYYCLENPTDRGAWQAKVHAVTKSWTQLSDFTSLSGHLTSPIPSGAQAQIPGLQDQSPTST